MRPGKAGAGRRGPVWVLLASLLLAGLGGCADDPRPPRGEDAVAGKTPVVRPEDVHGQGPGGTAVLAPDYRRELQPAVEAAEAEVAAGERPATPAPGQAGPGGQPAPAPAPTVEVRPAAPAAATDFPVPECRQLVLVVAADFSARRGVLRRLVRDAPGAPWREVGAGVDCVLGRSGLGWGRGLGAVPAGPVKRAGDGRAPAGLFPLTEAFGREDAQAARAAGVRLPYRMVSDQLACVTEPDSPLFGRLAGPEERLARGGRRQERMARGDGANAWGVVIGHNLDRPDPAAGACVFVNVRPAGGSATGGSIGLPEAAAASLVAWLDPAAKPLLAVLPEERYRELRAGWGLP